MSRTSPPPTSAAGDRARPSRRYHSLERVQLRRAVPEHGVEGGEVGTIVHVFEAAPAYLVEFVNPDGSTRALIEVTPDQIAPARASASA